LGSNSGAGKQLGVNGAKTSLGEEGLRTTTEGRIEMTIVVKMRAPVRGNVVHRAGAEGRKIKRRSQEIGTNRGARLARTGERSFMGHDPAGVGSEKGAR